MCEGGNDNIKEVWRYLKGYQDCLAYIENLKADIADMQAELALSPVAKTATLSASGGCGGGERQSIEETAYFKREAMEKRIHEMTQELHRLERIANRVTRTVNSLNDADKNLVKRRVFYNDSWTLIALDLKTSESSCKRRLDKIIEILANRMFGPADFPQQTSFQF